MTDFLGRWEVAELVAVMWNDDMAQRFPNANHAFCRVQMDLATGDVLRCVGWHCNRCGVATSCQGHHACPDRPQP